MPRLKVHLHLVFENHRLDSLRLDRESHNNFAIFAWRDEIFSMLRAAGHRLQVAGPAWLDNHRQLGHSNTTTAPAHGQGICHFNINIDIALYSTMKLELIMMADHLHLKYYFLLTIK